MQYMGGKSRISKQISEILNSAINKDTPFVSLFCGSCAIESKVQADIKILNDKHPYLIAMWQAIKKGDNYCARAERSLLKDLPGVKNATFTCLDYRDVEIPDGAIVYADPPYANTTGYTLGQFDTNEFWDYMRQLSKRCEVYISEESAPDDFECIWSQELTRTLDYNKSNQPKKVEKLFKYKG